MKRHWIFRIVCILLAIIIPWMIKSLPTPLLDKDCSPLYQRYADDPDIEASFVKGFRINDTLAIDATLLRATDSAGWERLVEDFHLSKFIDSSAYNIPRSAVFSKVLKKDPTIRRTNPNEPFCCRIALPYEKEIHVYDAGNKEQNIALTKYFLLRMSNH